MIEGRIKSFRDAADREGMAKKMGTVQSDVYYTFLSRRNGFQIDTSLFSLSFPRLLCSQPLWKPREKKSHIIMYYVEQK